MLPLLHQQPSAEQPGQHVHQLQAAFHLLSFIIWSVTHKQVVFSICTERTPVVSLMLYTEVLPLVQFYLEEGISDEEAVSLIDLEVPHTDQRDARWHDMDNGGILC